ncbi:hypothetical protein GCM10027160_49980 [Streptomyces calidiresistens]|uniref:Tetratricopeptide repeat protein n=1 Tax=Streptomyces calidiresistens TaxID=1485586 RepID=A0A7W3T3I5_9ACTN|nr:hypothetical protein [Streptomyces calidiresistens]MBB0230294.1 hypothetical protein [Streptomyces calidiresistens]
MTPGGPTADPPSAPGTSPAAGPDAGAGDGTVVMDERLRMVPADPAAYRAAHARAEAALAAARAGGGPVGFAPLRRVGVGRLVLGDPAGARGPLAEAVRCADTPRRRVAALVNLADAHRYDDGGPHRGPTGGAPGRARALSLYRRALRLARRACPELEHFALQHLGKHHLDADEPDRARPLLLAALRARRELGDAELIASTEAALARCGGPPAAPGAD